MTHKRDKKEDTREGWVRNLATTTGITGGNSDHLSYHLDFETIYRSKENEFFFKTGYRYAESNGSSQQNRYQLGTRYNWKFNPYTYVGLGLSFLHDDSQDLSYRASLGAHVGHYFILTGKGGFSLEGGLSHTSESKGGNSTSYLSIQAAQRLYWQVGYHTYITQEIAYDVPAEDPGNFNINSYLYLDTILSDHLSWRVGAEFYYNSNPAAGAAKDDFSLTTGISFRF